MFFQIGRPGKGGQGVGGGNNQYKTLPSHTKLIVFFLWKSIRSKNPELSQQLQISGLPIKI